MTKIEWTNESWNPVTGCAKVSPGCKNCYAEKMAKRLKAMGQPNYRNGFAVTLQAQELGAPETWRKPRKVFVNSMSDLFHEAIPDEYVYQVFLSMSRAPRHIFQVLTKRPERMREIVPKIRSKLVDRLEHVWLGVSCENLATALERIPILRDVPAAIRFVSFEPLLEDVGELDLAGIDWAIIGGESGPGARPFNIEWARNIIRQCREQKVAAFVKQVGSNPIVFDEITRTRGETTRITMKPAKLKARKGNDPAEWPVDLRIREFPLTVII